MRIVMVRAWAIARDAANKFGGKVKEYFQQALIMAWAERKEVKAVKTTGNKLADEFINNINERFEKALSTGRLSADRISRVCRAIEKYIAKNGASNISNLMQIKNRNIKSVYNVIILSVGL